MIRKLFLHNYITIDIDLQENAFFYNEFTKPSQNRKNDTRFPLTNPAQCAIIRSLFPVKMAESCETAIGGALENPLSGCRRCKAGMLAESLRQEDREDYVTYAYVFSILFSEPPYDAVATFFAY